MHYSLVVFERTQNALYKFSLKVMIDKDTNFAKCISSFLLKQESNIFCPKSWTIWQNDWPLSKKCYIRSFSFSSCYSVFQQNWLNSGNKCMDGWMTSNRAVPTASVHLNFCHNEGQSRPLFVYFWSFINATTNKVQNLTICKQ